MAARQINTSLADEVVNLKAVVDKQKEAVGNLKSRNADLMTTNQLLNKTIHNLSSLVITKSQRIQKTNDAARKLLLQIGNYEQIAKLLTMNTVSAEVIQEHLLPIFTNWSYAKCYADFLPGALVDKTGQHGRPVFTFQNLQEKLKFPEICNKLQLSSLVYQYSQSMHVDVRCFTYLKPDKSHTTSLHGYFSIISTIMLWNLFSEDQILYDASVDICIDYSNESYLEVMKLNCQDICFEKEPISRRDTFKVDFNAQLNRPKRPKY